MASGVRINRIVVSVLSVCCSPRPQDEDPEFRRTRFAFDGRYKLYMDGRMFDIKNDSEEESPMFAESITTKVEVAKDKLQKALDAMPHWEPDNSIFAGKPDRQSQERARQIAQIRQQSLAPATAPQ